MRRLTLLAVIPVIGLLACQGATRAPAVKTAPTPVVVAAKPTVWA
jgi:hypothetical protein